MLGASMMLRVTQFACGLAGGLHGCVQHRQVASDGELMHERVVVAEVMGEKLLRRRQQIQCEQDWYHPANQDGVEYSRHGLVVDHFLLIKMAYVVLSPCTRKSCGSARHHVETELKKHLGVK